MEQRKRLPIGVESFREIRQGNFYYVDKTSLIEQLLTDWSKVSLFTRPRRFGKSLNMSMLQHFFETGADSSLFEGMHIWENQKLCGRYFGKSPVISISLKGVEGTSFEMACAALKAVIGREAMRFPFLSGSDFLTEQEKALYIQLIKTAKNGNGMFAMSLDVLAGSLQTLSYLLEKHYGRPVIMLIDEYDVPLDKAFQYGYYDEMVSLIRAILGNALKTNNSLDFAVLTGCLRITKESIFTGLNNFKVYPITHAAFEECFGFTDAEVKKLLNYYGLDMDYHVVKAWYDGYRFGGTEIYCPWDVINYCADHRAESDMPPQNYWINTSGNAIVRRFIDMAGAQTRNEIEKLIEGESIAKDIHLELTYNELDKTIDHLWSVLFTTGYLTQHGRTEDGKYRLAIPNQEIRRLFIRQIREWFRETVQRDSKTLAVFCNAFPEQNAGQIETLFGDYLWNMISVRDNATREKKENFYHGILLGLLRSREDWIIRSNAESGDGYSDILVEIPKTRTGIVIELKYAEHGKLEAACVEALRQIQDNQYEDALKRDGMKHIIRYGIACYRKECMVKMA